MLVKGTTGYKHVNQALGQLYGSDSGLLSVWHRAYIWTNVDVLSNTPSGICFNKVWFEIQQVIFMGMHLKNFIKKYVSLGFDIFTLQYGLVMPYSMISLGQHWFRQWLNDTKPLPELIVTYCQLNLEKYILVNFESKTFDIIYENPFGNVYKILAIVFFSLNVKAAANDLHHVHISQCFIMGTFYNFWPIQVACFVVFLVLVIACR